MTKSILTPLQLTATSELLSGRGIRGIPPALAAAINTFNSIALFQNLNAARDSAGNSDLEQGDGTWCSQSTLAQLQSISGLLADRSWALGNSAPAAADQLLQVVSPSGLSGLVLQTVARYLGTDSITQFAQNFMAVSGYISIANDFITSAANAQNYLGAAYSGMNDLITGDITRVSSDLSSLAQDLHRQGQLWNPANLELYGTPAGLLQQINHVSGIQNRTLPGLESRMLALGMTASDIADLVNNRRQSLFNPDGLSDNQFDTLQKTAYAAMAQAEPAEVELVKNLLDITTPGITRMTDLLDPRLVFPTSYPSLTTQSPTGPVPIYDATGHVASNIRPTVSAYLPTQSGCDELGKIIPPDQAVANKAIQVSLAQIPNIASLDLPTLASAIQQAITRPWNPNTDYLPNDVVALGVPGAPGFENQVPAATTQPSYYQAQQSVPPGTNINDTNYWLPTTLPGLSTLSGLNQLLVETANRPLPSVSADYYQDNMAVGTGPGGTLTMCDLLGTAIDRNGLASKFNTATTLISQLSAAGVLTDLLAVYERMQLVTSGAYGNPETGPVTIPLGPGAGTYETLVPVYAGDAALQALIPLANSAIAVIVQTPAVDAIVQELNQVWQEIALSLNQERLLQSRGGIDYFETVPANQVSVMALVGNLPNYAQQVAACQTAQFLESIADVDTLGGQAIVGAMREARNQAQLDAAGIFTSNRVSADATVSAVPAVTPVR